MTESGGTWASPGGTGDRPSAGDGPGDGRPAPPERAPERPEPRFGVLAPATASPADRVPPAPAAAYRPPPRPGLFPLHPLSFGRLLGTAFAVLRWNPRASIPPALIVQVLVTLLTVGGVAAIGIGFFGRVTQASDDDRGAIIAGGIAASVIALLVLLAIGVVGQAVVQGMVVIVVARGGLAEKPRFVQVLREAGRSLVPLMLYALLVGAAEGGAILVVALSVTGLALLGPIGAVFAVAAGALGLVGIVVLFAWLSTKLSVAPSAVVLERIGVFSAVGRSWRLTRGSFWRTFGAVYLVALIVGVVSQAIVQPVVFISSLLAALLAPNGVSDDDPAAFIGPLLLSTVPALVISALVGAITLVAQASVTAAVYVDLRMRREGIDLEMRRAVEEPGSGDPFLVRR